MNLMIHIIKKSELTCRTLYKASSSLLLFREGIPVFYLYRSKH